MTGHRHGTCAVWWQPDSSNAELLTALQIRLTKIGIDLKLFSYYLLQNEKFEYLLKDWHFTISVSFPLFPA